MSCWDILGIEPTGDLERIRDAYERQLKFASPEEARQLEQAFREATGQAAPAADSGPTGATREASAAAAGPERPDARDAQIVREVVIQIRALLNDSERSQNLSVWRAILCEPPADRPELRREIGLQLESWLRPLAENGSLQAPVAGFLGNWFGWFGDQQEPSPVDERRYPEGKGAEAENLPPQAVNFWPAVIGWIVGLAILASIFGGMTGG